MTAGPTADRLSGATLPLMRQAVIVQPDRFDVVAAPRPRLRADDEVLVRTAACGICSGDLMPWYLQKKVGTVLGHEVVGWAAEVGKAVSHLRPGDLVFLHHHAPCHACEDCAREAYVHCRTWRTSRIDPGGMAEWVRVPGVNTRHDTFAVNELPVERAVFIEPLGCCLKALLTYQAGRKARWLSAYSGRRPRGQLTGVVVGCGAMGLLNLDVARALGVPQRFAVEPDPDRRRIALDRGATAAFPPEEAQRQLAGRADFVVIGPGHPDVVRQALGYVRPGGTAILFTPTPAGVATPLDLGELYFREVTLLPSYSCGPNDTRLAYEWLKEGLVCPDGLVTHRFALDEVQRAYDTARRGGPALKVLVTFAAEQSS